MKLLCAADLHLGRLPSRLPDEVGDVPGLPAELAPGAAWRRLVDVAIAEEVSALLLAGDLLDDEHDYFETYGDLRAGVERLVDAGIAVLAVSGNHDVGVLPRLADAVDGLTMLGAGGVWQVVTISDGDATVHVAGWSYPQPRVATSPVPQLAPALHASGLEGTHDTVIAMLHCDRDQTGSRYAPVMSRELAEAPVDVWLLGHVHKPDFGPMGLGGAAAGAGSTTVVPGAAAARLGGYLGAISPGDPGEEGEHGAWLLELDGSRDAPVVLRRVPLAALRYETLTLDVSDLDAPGALGTRLSAALAELGSELVAAPTRSGLLRAVGARVRFVGRSPIRADLSAELARDDPRGLVLRLETEGGSLLAFVHDHRFEVRPTHDLAAMAAGHDPLALLARKLLVLDDLDDPARMDLLDAARTDLGAVAAGRHYTALDAPDLSDTLLADLLRHSALDLLDAMLASRGSA